MNSGLYNSLAPADVVCSIENVISKNYIISMLTKSDLYQIQKIFNTETKKNVNVETKKIIVQELKPIKDDITHIRKDIKTIINYFDREYLELRKRVERLENHLHLSPLS